MSLIRKVARPLLGAGFIADGIDRLRNTEEAAEKLEPTLEELSSLIPQAEIVTADPRRTAQVLGGVEVVAGVALAIGRFPRLAAFTLVGVHKVNSYVELRSAGLESVEDLTSQRDTLLKNLAILGGLGLAVADLDGKPSLGWRAEHLATRSRKKGAQFRDKTYQWAEDFGDDAVKTAKALERDAAKSFKRAEKEAVKAISAAAKEGKKKAEDAF
ncbi:MULTISPECIES: DoxX family protein [Nesterenkonia]|uniref:Putative membrane protein YphA (DoxX/SURF4 family) n=1 Tax=Nesterenkonia xinjiangensis TaxID=225327 RepID=A0A7Z0KD19_9MICC|nr:MULTISPECIES: DoxX family protein [Nesterenkonia]MDZ5076022.1 DoxX family protein [Nesterenkonia sp. HG001]NYJ79207.1 putative membrane protein YphA (DoxX/SURF4 family) [Nesterenkonia xinjiangensis]